MEFSRAPEIWRAAEIAALRVRLADARQEIDDKNVQLAVARQRAKDLAGTLEDFEEDWELPPDVDDIDRLAELILTDPPAAHDLLRRMFPHAGIRAPQAILRLVAARAA